MNVILLTCIGLAFVFQISSAQLEVETSLGTIIGRELAYDESVFEYLGIRYAEPLNATNRFQPPKLFQSETEPLQVDGYGAACPQNEDILVAKLTESRTTDDDISGPAIEEDCLYLNIYKKNATTDLLPVMVYIHGGDFVSGSGMEYSGSALALNHDVIVVTINYRLGALGFLSDGSDAFPGNYGILDQQMALKWVNEHIEAFGGDPNLVTIFGSGAGGSSVHLHTSIESSLPYFNRAIIQSATYNDAVWRKETAKEQFDALLEALPADVDKLQDMSAEDIVKALEGPWQPVISDLIPDQPRYLTKNNSGIDILIGSESFDAYPIVESVDVSGSDWYDDAIEPLTSMTSEFYNWTSEDIDQRTKMFKQYYGGLMANVKEFPKLLRNRNRLKTRFLTEMYTDQLYESWAQEVAMLHSSMCECDVYKYHFNRNFSGIGEGRALSEDLLVYLFGFIAEDGEDEEKSLSERVMGMWTQFALDGTLPQDGAYDYETFTPYSTSNSSTNSCRSAIDIDITGNSVSEDLIAPRNWEFWKRYYVALGFSCSEESTDGEDGTYKPEDDTDVCEPGVWSDAGIVMSNEVAGALLITFICLTAVALIMFFCACHKNRKAKRKIKKVLADDISSVISNSSTRM